MLHYFFVTYIGSLVAFGFGKWSEAYMLVRILVPKMLDIVHMEMVVTLVYTTVHFCCVIVVAAKCCCNKVVRHA